MTKLDRLGWAATSSFLIGHHYIGVRSSTSDADDLIRRLLKVYLVPEAEAPANYSVRLGGGGRGRRELSLVYRSGSLVVRSRSVESAVAGLLHHLCWHQHEDPDGLLRARVAVVLRPEGGALLPHPAKDTLVGMSSSQLPAGVEVLQAPFARVDPGTAELITGPPPLELDPAAMAELRWSCGPDGVGPPQERRPITRWFFLGNDEADVSRGRTLALAASTLLNARQVGGQRSLEALGLVLGAIEPGLLRSVEPALLRRAWSQEDT